MKRKKSNWLRAMEYSLIANLLLVVVVSFISSFYVFFDNHVNFYYDVIDFIAFFFLLILYVGFGSIFITLFSSWFIGGLTVYILKTLGVAKPIFAALVGALTVYLVMLYFNGKHEWITLFYSFFGFVCGYAFMFGYQKQEKS